MEGSELLKISKEESLKEMSMVLLVTEIQETCESQFTVTNDRDTLIEACKSCMLSLIEVADTLTPIFPPDWHIMTLYYVNFKQIVYA